MSNNINRIRKNKLKGTGIFAAAAFPAVRSLCALIAGISLILAFGILGTMHRSRTNSASNRHNDGARI